MRITNVMGASRAFPYADKHGRTLKPGETSPELPLAVAQHKLFQADLTHKVMKVTLSQADKAHIAQLLAADAEELKPQEPPKLKSIAINARDVVKAQAQKAAAAKAAADARQVKTNPGGATGQPGYSPELAPIDVRPGEAKSLAQLMQANRSKAQGKVPQITGPMGSMV